MLTQLRRLSSRKTALSTSLPYCKYTTAAALAPVAQPDLDTPTKSVLVLDPSTKPALVLDHPTKSKYNDLESYLSNTSETRVDTTFIGTKYEYTVQSSLSRLGFDLTHNGGSSDYGIDLFGTWTLPSSPLSSSIKVLIQCKGQKTKVKPSIVRELEGIFAGAPRGWRRRSGVMAFLASTKAASKGVREALGRSTCPMGFVCCDGEGRVLQMLWNRRAEDQGLIGVGVCVRYPGEDEDELKIVDLTWKGEPTAE